MLDEMNQPIEWAWEGEFEYEDPAESKQLGGTKLPRLSIAKPLCLEPQVFLGETWRPPLANTRFDVIRFAISLRPLPRQTITQAEMVATFFARHEGNPTVYDVFPASVDAETSRSLTLGLTPTLKFKVAGAEVETSIPKIERTVTSKNVLRVVSTHGIQTSEITWKFAENAACPLNGDQLLYVVLATPSGASEIRVSVSVRAETRDTLFGGPFRGISPRAEAQDRLSHRLF